LRNAQTGGCLPIRFIGAFAGQKQVQRANIFIGLETLEKICRLATPGRKGDGESGVDAQFMHCPFAKPIRR
jgi:hypothetical protein